MTAPTSDAIRSSAGGPSARSAKQDRCEICGFALYDNPIFDAAHAVYVLHLLWRRGSVERADDESGIGSLPADGVQVPTPAFKADPNCPMNRPVDDVKGPESARRDSATAPGSRAPQSPAPSDPVSEGHGVSAAGTDPEKGGCEACNCCEPAGGEGCNDPKFGHDHHHALLASLRAREERLRVRNERLLRLIHRRQHGRRQFHHCGRCALIGLTRVEARSVLGEARDLPSERRKTLAGKQGGRGEGA